MNCLIGSGHEYASASFQEVKGFELRITQSSVDSGGENRYKLPSGSISSNLILTRGMMRRNSAMAQWISTTLSSAKFDKPIEPQTIQLLLVNNDNGTVV